MDYKHVKLPLDSPENTLPKLLAELRVPEEDLHGKIFLQTGETHDHYIARYQEKMAERKTAIERVEREILRRFQELEQRATTAETDVRESLETTTALLTRFKMKH